MLVQILLGWLALGALWRTAVKGRSLWGEAVAGSASELEWGLKLGMVGHAGRRLVWGQWSGNWKLGAAHGALGRRTRDT